MVEHETELSPPIDHSRACEIAPLAVILDSVEVAPREVEQHLAKQRTVGLRRLRTRGQKVRVQYPYDPHDDPLGERIERLSSLSVPLANTPGEDFFADRELVLLGAEQKLRDTMARRAVVTAMLEVTRPDQSEALIGDVIPWSLEIHFPNNASEADDTKESFALSVILSLAQTLDSTDDPHTKSKVIQAMGSQIFNCAGSSSKLELRSLLFNTALDNLDDHPDLIALFMAYVHHNGRHASRLYANLLRKVQDGTEPAARVVMAITACLRQPDGLIAHTSSTSLPVVTRVSMDVITRWLKDERFAMPEVTIPMDKTADRSSGADRKVWKAGDFMKLSQALAAAANIKRQAHQTELPADYDIQPANLYVAFSTILELLRRDGRHVGDAYAARPFLEACGELMQTITRTRMYLMGDLALQYASDEKVSDGAAARLLQRRLQRVRPKYNPLAVPSSTDGSVRAYFALQKQMYPGSHLG